MVNLEVPHFSTAAPLGATRRTVQPPFTLKAGRDLLEDGFILVLDSD